jgi:microcin C transport system substrate-binding protein
MSQNTQMALFTAKLPTPFPVGSNKVVGSRPSPAMTQEVAISPRLPRLLPNRPYPKTYGRITNAIMTDQAIAPSWMTATASGRPFRWRDHEFPLNQPSVASARRVPHPGGDHATRGRSVRIVLSLLMLVLTLPAWADDGPVTRSNAIAILGKPALPPDFPYFPYVDPNAPKGGEVTLASIGSFDGFNPFILRGTADAHSVSPWVTLPGGAGSGSSVGHVWESLLTPSANEIASGYGHLAQTIEMPADKLWVAFEIRPQAHFSDGTPVTADDVAWTYRTLLEKGRPSFRIQFADVKDVVVESPSRVVFHFKSAENRDLPMLVGGLPVLPKHFFAGRDFSAPLTDAPIGSGPYRISSFELGRSITFTRNPDWWAKDMPTGRGTNNFDRVRIEYFRDSTVAMQAFKAGEIDLRSENISKNWATAYDFPAVNDGQVIKDDFPHHLPTGMQGYAMNTRRTIFADPRVRQAIAWVFDFQWTNKNLFYGAYSRTTSYFENSDLASSGVPQGNELKLLEPYRSELPPDLFTKPFTLPVTDGSGNNRQELLYALHLLEQAGWKVKQRKLIGPNGEPMSFTILLDDPSLERVALPYVQSLQKLGMDVRVRTVDPAQYQHLTDNFDFDMTMQVYPESDIPGNELRDYWSCASAKAQGSMNLPGVCDPAVDALIEKIVAAQDRDTLNTAGRALDRVLLWRWYMVPNWDNRIFHIAHWNRFGHPDKPIREGFNFDTWWVDPARSAALAAARKQ